MIKSANRELGQSRYGSGAVSFQLAQVGNDLEARAFLEELDNNREIGGLIDVSPFSFFFLFLARSID